MLSFTSMDLLHPCNSSSFFLLLLPVFEHRECNVWFGIRRICGKIRSISSYVWRGFMVQTTLSSSSIIIQTIWTKRMKFTELHERVNSSSFSFVKSFIENVTSFEMNFKKTSDQLQKLEKTQHFFIFIELTFLVNSDEWWEQKSAAKKNGKEKNIDENAIYFPSIFDDCTQLFSLFKIRTMLMKHGNSINQLEVSKVKTF